MLVQTRDTKYRVPDGQTGPGMIDAMVTRLEETAMEYVKDGKRLVSELMLFKEERHGDHHDIHTEVFEVRGLGSTDDLGLVQSLLFTKLPDAFYMVFTVLYGPGEVAVKLARLYEEGREKEANVAVVEAVKEKHGESYPVRNALQIIYKDKVSLWVVEQAYYMQDRKVVLDRRFDSRDTSTKTPYVGVWMNVAKLKMYPGEPERVKIQFEK